jgi:RNA polymerase sigma factor (sigma-70 family)
MMDQSSLTTDHALLRDFVVAKNLSSFEELVRRHGPMVLTICRRQTGDYHLAEDAFQMVFTLLMHKASTLKPWKPLSHWLYRAAVMVARNARAKTNRRRSWEKLTDTIDRETPINQGSDASQLQPILDEEICRLPVKYSTPLLLCFFEGKTNEQAALELGYPRRTLTSRLEKARDLLRTRLMKRGVTAGVLMAALAQGNQVYAALPVTLIATTVQKATVSTAAGATLTGGSFALSTSAKMAITALVVVAGGGAIVLPAFLSHEPQRTGVFAQLPKPDPAHLSKLSELGDDSWIYLDTPAADPAWGRAYGRTWSPVMAYAPDLQGAFLFGEHDRNYLGEHGRYVDDLWFYHAPSHRWICVHPGTTLDKADVKLNEYGIESTIAGDPVPVATMLEANCAMTYDSERRQFVHMPQGEKMYLGQLSAKVAAYQAAGPPPAKNPSPWFFDTVSGKWNRLETDSQAPPQSSGMADLLFYLPTKKILLFNRSAFGLNYLSSYDPATTRWSPISDGREIRDHERIPPGASVNIAYFDSKRNRVDLLVGALHCILDTESMTWRDAASGGPSDVVFSSTWTYDSVNDVGILVTYRHPDTSRNGVWIYHPATNDWTKAARPLPIATTDCNAFYDPRLNVHFIYSAPSHAPGGMWAYRYHK